MSQPACDAAEEDFNLLIKAFFILFDRPEIISMGLHDLRAKRTTIKHGISADHHPAQIYVAQQLGSKGDFLPLVLNIHLS